MKHLYFEEKVNLNEAELLNVTDSEVVVTELKAKIEDVVPFGYICEDFIYHFNNENFEMKNSYRLRKNKRLSFDKIDYMAICNEMTSNFIRDSTVNQEIFFSVGVLTQNHLPNEIHPPMNKPLAIARINQTFACTYYLQKLKELSSGESKYFNILSGFFDRD